MNAPVVSRATAGRPVPVVARRLTLALGLLLVCTAPVRAQAQDEDGVTRVVTRLERLLQSGTVEGLASLAPLVPADELDRFADDFFSQSVSRALAFERDRQPLPNSLPGDGYRLILELFSEVGNHARIITARVDVRRPSDGDADSWRIVSLERLSFVEGLFRLTLDTATPLAARELVIDSEDLRITLHEGTVFKVMSDPGVTGLVLLGRGDMLFEPAPATEKGQMRIFAGSEKLLASFDTAYVRLNPGQYDAQVKASSLSPAPLDSRTVKRAQDVFVRESGKSYSLDLRDLSSERWFLLPGYGDFLAEIRTRKYGSLTYARSGNQAEDVTLFNRGRRRTISLYSSAEKLATRGRSYNEDELTDFDVTSYEVDLSVDPEREFIEGVARVTLRSRHDGLSTLTLRLADSLNVTNITSAQLGRLLFLRVRDQNSVIVNLPVSMNLDTELTLRVTYSGRLPSQTIEGSEGLALAAQQDSSDLEIPLESKYLLSNRAYWYPQNSVSDYATARLRIAVPPGYSCVASGQISTDTNVPLRDLLTPLSQGVPVIFTASEPVRYLSIVVSHFARVFESTVDSRNAAARPVVSPVRADPAAAPPRTAIALTVDANPRQQGRGRQLASTAEDIMRFYGTLMDDTPYGSMTVALVEDELPGGHSPAYAVVLNSLPPTSRMSWRNDPAAFLNFPEFFIAHELAHQWWGQAVGWQNYHEQWLSEGFAQYFSALYAQKVRGDGAFVDMLRQFRRWALADSDQGPIYLGYRLGHVKGDTTIFRALIYNKGAGVLHMLRRLLGDEVFFNGLRRFYREQKFQKAGTEDLRRAFEEESGVPLGRFFERWIYGADVPRLRYTTVIGSGEVIVRFEQEGDALFDVPVTVTLTYTDGRVRDVMVPVTDKRVERRIPTEGTVRQVQVNRDAAALARFDES